MNRVFFAIISLNFRKPHVRGDEPLIRGHVPLGCKVSPTCVGMNRSLPPPARGVDAVSPTCVGMNRACRAYQARLGRKPHVRGDEPTGISGNRLPIK